jgi:DHA2 family multidrug resistance protein
MVMTPLAAIAMVGISPAEAGGASGLFNMLRNLGGAIGTSALETFFTRREEYHSFIINADVSLLRPATQSRLTELQQYFIGHGAPDAAGAMQRAMIAIGDIVRAQATFMGYADCFALLGVVLLCALGAVAMLKKGSVTAGGAH